MIIHSPNQIVIKSTFW